MTIAPEANITLYEMLDAIGDSKVLCESSAGWYVPLRTIRRAVGYKDRWDIEMIFASSMPTVYIRVDRETILALVRKHSPMQFYLH